ncbi:DUF3054 domain-containing protein [Microbacterium sp. G2-8]|uniref:DUF3054 domain-containing protein n=1 Tax=Microbacterium sp. G2-8 TaxID=2842454 RepID=UPI001C8AA0FC|nr:DUF3054 domain-containing protein [Microbacterium sp. G2-8]
MTPARSFPWILALAIDVALVVAFAAIGMRSHHGGFTALGLLETAWPFLVGALLGWLVARAWRRPARLGTGLLIWFVAAAGGMALRVATGGGFAWSFLIVTLVVLAALLIGWRAIAALVARIRARPRT